MRDVKNFWKKSLLGEIIDKLDKDEYNSVTFDVSIPWFMSKMTNGHFTKQCNNINLIISVPNKQILSL